MYNDKNQKAFDVLANSEVLKETITHLAEEHA
jgi:hypothetical protein